MLGSGILQSCCPAMAPLCLSLVGVNVGCQALGNKGQRWAGTH